MNKTRFASVILVLGIFLTACTPKNAGFLTVVNSGVTALDFSVDGRPFSVLASNHITKEVAGGTHKIKLGDNDIVEANVSPKMTTVFDFTGLSCFAVADFTDRYRGGAVKIIETFKHQRIFFPSTEISVILGSYLPKKAPGDKRVTRIQQIDCDDIGDPQAIEEMLARAL